MMQELIYTSAPRGLKPGVRGFCTVASTQQITQPLADRLEALSGYRHLFAAHEPQAHLNPVIHSHLLMTVGGRKYHVLSRIADAGLDYTQRSNKIAHHVALDGASLSGGGPAWLLSQPGFMQTKWESEPSLLPAGRRPPDGFAPPAVCRHWQTLTGDAGWAGALAENGADPKAPPACLLFQPGQDLLPLVAEALALLPLDRRWQVTFSTWYTKLPPDLDCQWRFFVADSAEAKTARRQQRGLWIDLTAAMPRAGAGKWVEAARTGVVTTVAQPAAKAPAAAASVTPRSVAVGAGAAAPALAPAEFGLDLAAMPIRPAAPVPIASAPAVPKLSRPAAGGASSWKVWAAVGAMAAMLLFTTVIGLVAFYAGRATERQLAKVEPAAVTDASALDLEPPATPDPAAQDPPADAAPSRDSRGNASANPLAGGNPPAGAAPATGGNAAPNENGAGAAAPNPLHQDGRPAEQTGGNVPPASPPANSGERGKPPEKVNDRPANPFAELLAQGRQLELPANAMKRNLVLLSPLDANAFDLKIIGWSELQPGHTIDYPRRDAGQDQVEWPITEKIENSFALPETIGVFRLAQGQLQFEWGKKKHPALASCLLELRVKQKDGSDAVEVATLREAGAIATPAIDFKQAIVEVPLPISEPSAQISKHCVRLRLSVAKGAAAPEIGNHQLEPANGTVYCEAYSSGARDKRKPVDKAGDPPRAVKLTIPFDQQARVEITARLLTPANGPAAIEFKSRWIHRVYDQQQGAVEDKDVSLSRPAVEKYRKQLPGADKVEKLAMEIADAAKARDKIQQTLDELKKDAKGNAETITKHEQDVAKHQERIARLESEKTFIATEPARCDKLLKLLDDLAPRIQLQVYYQFGDKDEERMRVMLCVSAEGSSFQDL